MDVEATHICHHYHAKHRLDQQETDIFVSDCASGDQHEGSKRLNTLQGSMLILSASGMATGGRVVHHLKAFAPDPRNTLLFIGFQAAGTRSDTLLDGVKHIKIHGEYVPVHVQATSISNLSAHADYEEMLAWLSGIEHTPNIRSSLTASLWRPTPCARRLRKRWDGQSRSRNTCRP